MASTRTASLRATVVRRRASARPSRASFTREAISSSCVPDPAEQVEVVDEVGKRRRAEHEREDVGPVGHVQVAHPALETPEGDVVLPAQPRQPCRLRGDRPLERRETRARARERAFEHRQTGLLGVDPRLEVADLLGDGAELAGQHAGLVLLRCCLPTQPAEPGVDASLVRAGIADSGAGGEEGCEGHGCGSNEARATTHQSIFAPASEVPARRGPSRSSVRSASAASRRRLPTTAR